MSLTMQFEHSSNFRRIIWISWDLNVVPFWDQIGWVEIFGPVRMQGPEEDLRARGPAWKGPKAENNGIFYETKSAGAHISKTSCIREKRSLEFGNRSLVA